MRYLLAADGRRMPGGPTRYGQACWRPEEPEDIHSTTLPEEGDLAPTTWGPLPQKRNADGELMWDAMDPTFPVLDWPM
ncbi:hypothetical protein LTS18_002699 [Coniosporium uncinatum]|uniref:Uncharacterized protein n=1 Tax=Coniosporium uncinatum TaxID=93489 RepID=A0ACC3DD37_9PEZI|nr:hypothetical protein LTS18_002699 [Coniosporium uncinatum]